MMVLAGLLYSTEGTCIPVCQSCKIWSAFTCVVSFFFSVPALKLTLHSIKWPIGPVLIAFGWCLGADCTSQWLTFLKQFICSVHHAVSVTLSNGKAYHTVHTTPLFVCWGSVCLCTLLYKTCHAECGRAWLAYNRTLWSSSCSVLNVVSLEYDEEMWALSIAHRSLLCSHTVKPDQQGTQINLGMSFWELLGVHKNELDRHEHNESCSLLLLLCSSGFRLRFCARRLVFVF